MLVKHVSFVDLSRSSLNLIQIYICICDQIGLPLLASHSILAQHFIRVKLETHWYTFSKYVLPL
jgi:hypothetical protein